MKDYKKRKEKYVSRLSAIIQYVNQHKECRSVMIGRYFGDESIKDCGICNNCLDRISKNISKPEFDSIYQNIKTILIDGPVPYKQFLFQLNGIKKEKAWEVINFLQSENKIEISVDNKVQWLK